MQEGIGMQQPSVKRNFIYNTAYQVLCLIIPLITTPYISRVLGSANIGIYSYSSSIVAYFSLFSLLGIHSFASREIAYCKDDLSRNYVFNSVQTTKIVLTLISLISYIVISIKFSTYTEVMLILSITILANFFDITWYYQGQQNFKIIVLRNLIVKIVGIVCIFLFVKCENDLCIYALINMLSTLIGNISLWINFLKNNNKIKIIIPSKYLIKTTIELFIPLVAIQVYNVLDKTMLGVISKNMSENGFYEQTTKIINLCLVLVTSLTTVLAPKMASLYSENRMEDIKDNVEKTYHAVMLISIPLCFGIIGISDNFVPWFFGDGYQKVATLLKIYAVVLMIIPLSNVAGAVILNPIKQHNKGTIAVVAGAIVNFVLNCVLIRYYDSIGAAIATIIAESTVTVIHFCFVRNYVSFKSIFKKLFQFLLGSVVMLGGVWIIAAVLKPKFTSTFIITAIQIIAGILIYFLYIVFVLKDSMVCSLVENEKSVLQAFFKRK